MTMQTIAPTFSHSTPTRATIEAAIGQLEDQCQALVNQGVEKGSVQSYRPGRYRLHWRDENGKPKQSPTIPAETVGEYRAAHQRWVQLQTLKRQIRRLENWLTEFVQTA